MTSPSGGQPPAPLLKASLLSRWTFAWVSPIFASRGKLGLQDLWRLVPEDSTALLAARLRSAWNAERVRPAPSLESAFVAAFGAGYVLFSCWLLVKACLVLGQVELLGILLAELASADVSSNTPYATAGAMCVCAICAGVLHHHYFFEGWRAGMRWRAAAMALVFEKTLRLRLESLAAASAGRVVNIVTNDVERFSKLSQYLSYVVVAPLEAAVIIWLIYRENGAATFAGLAMLIVLVVVQTSFSRRFGALRSATAVLTDARVKATSQAVTGIRVIKMMTWERAFAASVARVRADEIVLIRRASILRGMNEAVFGITPFVAGAAVFLTVYATGGALSPRLVFVTLSLFSFLQVELTKFLPSAFEGIAECRVTLARIQSFLLLPEFDGVGGIAIHSEIEAEKVPVPAITLRDLSCAWARTAAPPASSAVVAIASPLATAAPRLTLDRVSLSVERGSLCCVVGPVGAGKSSLLLAMLHELAPLSGSVTVRGSVAYVSQGPWIVAGSLRENILMGRPENALWLGRVVHACCLDDDLVQLPHGADTHIGERGVTLSGGQKARVSLARAVYSDADVVLLDDVLSAVDARVGALIFSRCIEGLLATKTRVLVTHQLQYTRAASTLVVLGAGGRIALKGSFSEVSSLHAAARAASTDGDGGVGEALAELFAPQTEANAGVVESGAHAEADPALAEPDAASPPSDAAAPEALPASNAESRNVLLQYAAGAGSVATIVAVSALLVAGTAAFLLSSVVLAQWAGLAPGAAQHDTVHAATYGGLVALSFALSIVRCYAFFSASVAASARAHDAAFLRVLSAPVSFFDTNPSGRILNRFSKDLGVADDFLPLTAFDFLASLLLSGGIVIVVCAVAPFVLIAALPLIWASLALRSYYMPTARVVKQLEGASRSPVLSLFSEVLLGLPSIRSFGLQPMLLEKYVSTSDANVGAYFAFIATNRWLGIRLDALTFILLLATTFVCVGLRGTLSSSLIGLALSSILQVTNSYQWTIRQSSELENSLVSIERLMEYAALSPVEDVDVLGDVQSTRFVGADEAWPSAGRIEFDRVCMRYRPSLAPVLCGVSFVAAGGTRVGIVGRTGAGKSSVFTALLRLVEPWRGIEPSDNLSSEVDERRDCGAEEPQVSGVSIDGVDVASIPLSRLRRAISVIPQDPVLFAGTLRSNIDPFRQSSDEACLEALERVQLAGSHSLASTIDESGANLSVGERQLLCLARAILRRNKILLMDEATANVDADTDRRIQDVVRSHFAGATVLTIAHRLATVMDYDSIVVVSGGLVVASGQPAVVLKDGRLPA